MNANSTLDGRALAQNGAVTFNGDGGNLPSPAAPVFTGIARTRTNATSSSTPRLISGDPAIQPHPVPHELDDDGHELSGHQHLDVHRYHATPTVPKRFYRAFITAP